MEFAEAKPKLPTKAETEELHSAYDQAVQSLQERVWELRKLGHAVAESQAPIPSFEDLGRLNVLIENLQSAHGVLGGKIAELRGLLDEFQLRRNRFEARQDA